MALAALILVGRPLAAQKADTLPRDTATLAPVVVTGVRLPAVREIVRGLAGRTATLTAEDLDARGVRSLADALEQLPGVTTSDELGASGQLDVALRGFQVSPVIGVPQGVTVYVDGVRANEPDAHEVNFDLLPLEDVERVEVVYGPSVLLGRNALGAAVNLVTRRGAVPPSREVEASAGSANRYELKVHAGARRGVWDYYLGARYEREAGWRQDTESRIATLFAKVGVLNGTWDATLSYSGADNKIFQAGSLPESLAVARPDSNFTPGDYFAPQAHLVILNAQRLLGRAQLAVNAFGRTLNSEQFNVNLIGPAVRERNRTRIGGAAVQLSGKLRVDGRELRWLAGADADYQGTAVRIFAAPGGGRADSLTESVRSHQVDGGAFVGGNLELVSRLTATVAARYDWVRVPFEDLVDPTKSGVNVFRRVNPRAGLSWRAGPHEVFTSVSGGFRPPAVVEIGCSSPQVACPLPVALGPDPALNPVVATTYELGWRYDAPHARFNASANLYRTAVRDEIFFVASTITSGYFQNVSATRRSGLELALGWQSPAGLRLYANYGYTSATFQTTARLATARASAGETVIPGDVLPMVPNHRVNAGLSAPVFTRPGGLALRVGLDARYVGRQWLRGDEANVTRRLADYAVTDGSITLTWHDVELRTAVRNVLDQQYFTFGTFAQNPTAPGAPIQRWLTPGLPRSVQVSLSADF
ncbi:MAG TPA: TonB-dependent receptor [Gemmatimonadales bacterium]|nr:TonB-dependent receptor [Gemmatimonadales bacterium]